MTRDEAIFLILGRCGQRQNDLTLQKACVLEMNLAQKVKLERAAFKPWFLLAEEEMVKPAGTAKVPLPAGFLEEYEDGAVWTRVYLEQAPFSPWRQLRKMAFDLADERPVVKAGMPGSYAITGGAMTLFPVLSVPSELRLKYYRAVDPILAAYDSALPPSGPSNLWLANSPDWLIGETGAVIAGMYIKDTATAQAFAAQADVARNALMVACVAREEANRTRSMGDD